MAKKDPKYTPLQRRKNNHKKSKTRDFSEEEREYIKYKYINSNGKCEGLCSKIKEELGPDISVFQVVGYTMFLHGQVKNGTINLKDTVSYKKVMQSHRKEWSKYEKHYNCANFMKFYKENFEIVENIIWGIAGFFSKYMDPKDMHSELILRLAESNVLKNYNPNNDRGAKLRTYLWGRVRGYARHILSEEMRNKYIVFKDKELKKYAEELLKTKNLLPENYFEKKWCPRNYIKPDKDIIIKEVISCSLDQDQGIDIPVEYPIENSVAFKEMMDYAKTALNKEQYKVFSLRCEGYNDFNIAKKLNVTSMWVGIIRNQYSEILKKRFKGDF